MRRGPSADLQKLVWVLIQSDIGRAWKNTPTFQQMLTGTPTAMPLVSGSPLTKNDSIRIEVFIPPIRSKQGMIYKTVDCWRSSDESQQTVPRVCNHLMMRHKIMFHPDSLILTLPLGNSVTLCNLLNPSEPISSSKKLQKY